MNTSLQLKCGVPLIAAAFILGQGSAHAASVKRFLGPQAWQCTFGATMSETREEETGPGGAADADKRAFFQAMANTGVQMEQPGGMTDSYRQETEQRVEGRIRLHYVYDGGLDGIQIAGWDNGSADVYLKSHFEGTEQNKKIFRDKAASFDGKTGFYGDEYSPGFQVWIYPEEGTYTLEYALAPVTAQQVEHCRMADGMEADRRKAESATDADMPLGGFMSGLTRATCATEKRSEVDLEGGAMSGFVENVPIPSSGLVLAGEAPSGFVDSGGVVIRWSCEPE